jgi:hypothetical protein
MSDLHLRQRSTARDRGLLVVSAAALGGFVIVLAFVLLSGGADTFDRSVASWMHPLSGTTTSTVAAAITGVGSFPAVVTVSLLAITALWAQTRQLWPSAIMASSVATTAGLVT